MTVKEATMNHRYQVVVNFIGSDLDQIVNSYSRREVAEKCKAALSDPLRPDAFISRAWIRDTLDTVSDADILATGA